MDHQADQSVNEILDEGQAVSGNRFNETSQTSASMNDRANVRKEQFTIKQRLDMYAFCVLELETHGNTVSIKKRQQAIKRALSHSQVKEEKHELPSNEQPGESQQIAPPSNITTPATTTTGTAHSDRTVTSTSTSTTTATAPTAPTATDLESNQLAIKTISQQKLQHQGAKIVVLTEDMACQLQQQQQQHGTFVQRTDETLLTDDEKTLEQLQREISTNLKCYSDYQRTQVLTSAMLKNVQARFAKYYPNSVVPSRTTIKHVFEKCIAHGTVDNIKNPRKPSKITEGSQIEQLLEREPQLSLRQLAARLKVSVGTISRRCKALGLIPESVTIKHQQLAMARRQKQMKQQSEDIAVTKSSPTKVGRPAKVTASNGCKTRRQNNSCAR